MPLFIKALLKMSEWITQSENGYAVFNIKTKLEIVPFYHKQCYNKHLEYCLSVCIYVCKFYYFIMRTQNLVESVKYFITAKFEQRSANILYAWKGVNVLYLFVNRNTSHAIKLITVEGVAFRDFLGFWSFLSYHASHHNPIPIPY